jgi:hypothetical protein
MLAFLRLYCHRLAAHGSQAFTVGVDDTESIA